jgi:hypothetical protein
MRLTDIPVLKPVLMRRDTHAYPGSALGVLLSRTALDLDMRASQYALTYPIEIPELSHRPCALRVYPTKTTGRESWRAGHQRGSWSVIDNPVLRQWIAGSVACNAVLRWRIDADNVVLKIR